jgi:hypothetical protein
MISGGVGILVFGMWYLVFGIWYSPVVILNAQFLTFLTSSL